MKIHRISQLTGKAHVMEIPITQDQINAWMDGGMIQNVAPELTPDQREFIISGITKEEWDEAFG